MTGRDLRRVRARNGGRSPFGGLVVAVAACGFIAACARTQLSELEWQNELNPAKPAGGAFSGVAGGRGSVAGRSGSAGRANSSPLGGGPSISLGGHGGDAGQAGELGEGGVGGEDVGTRELPTCPRAVTLALDGPLVQETQGLVDSAVSGDWNRDGKLDLAGANEDGSVSVLFGFGDGSFDSSAGY